MSPLDLTRVVVSNDMSLPEPALMPPALPHVDPLKPKLQHHTSKHHDSKFWQRLQTWLHHNLVVVFALLFLLVGAAAITVAGIYRSAHISLATIQSSHIPLPPAKGPNLVLAENQYADALSKITSQPLNLSINNKTVPVSSDAIKSWLQIVENHKQGVVYIHVNEAAVNKSLTDAATPFVKAPQNQVVLQHPDGTSQVISAGRNGTSLGDVTPMTKQVVQSVLTGKGAQLTLPIQTQVFAVSTAADISKLIEVNVVTKQMYLYEKGQLVRSYPISAGAPATPTPIGQFQIYQKLTVQDMKGFNPDGSKYFQPHVHWINYFLPGGYAVHGNYWRPTSWFGAINSSHGCVSLPDDQAKWVYDWAPLGTTVITHY